MGEFTNLFRQFIQERGLNNASVFTIEDVFEWFKAKYPLKLRRNIKEQLLKHTTNCPQRIEFPRPADYSEDLFHSLHHLTFDTFQLYQDGLHDVPLHKDSIVYEAELRDYFAIHSDEIECGLILKGSEYPAGRAGLRPRSIDLLFTDRDDNWLVAELKVSLAFDQTIGQLLWYMAWVSQNLAVPRQIVRGIIIAPKVSEDLRWAVLMVPNVTWLECKLPSRS